MLQVTVTIEHVTPLQRMYVLMCGVLCDKPLQSYRRKGTTCTAVLV